VIGIFTRKYLFLYLLPVIIMITFTVFFLMTTDEMQNNLIKEKFAEKKLEVAMIANHADAFIAQNNDWSTKHNYYKQSIIFDMQALDSADMTYAVVFDSTLTPLSSQVNYTGGFNPLAYPDFISAINNNNIGDAVYHFAPTDGPERDIYLHYQWIPTGPQYNDRFLVVVAISRYTILTQMSVGYQWGAAALIIITTLLNMITVFIMTRLVNAMQKCDLTLRQKNDKS